MIFLLQNEQLTFMWIMFAMIVIGNSSVLIHTQVVKKNKNSRMSFFIMHLALAGKRFSRIVATDRFFLHQTFSWVSLMFPLKSPGG